MPSFRTKDIRAALTSKGFVDVETHHGMFWYYVDGKKTSVRTRLSRGISEYGDSLLGQMTKQLHLTRSELGELIECPLTGEKYREILKEKGVITPPSLPS